MKNVQKKNGIDFIGIGAPKTGTTWFAQCLSEHPDICFSSKKEIHFFNKTYQFHRKNPSWNYQKELKWYLDFFSHCTSDTKKRGEFSVHYLYDKDTPRLIYKHFPSVKLIAILRNPVDQVYSNYHHVRSQYEISSFEEMVASKSGFIPYGFYSKYIERYLEVFPREQLLVLLYENIQKDPAAVIKKAFTYLDVDPTFIPPSLEKVINATGPKTTPEVRGFFWIRNRCIATAKKYGLIHKIHKVPFLMWLDRVLFKSLFKFASLRKKKYKPLSGRLRKQVHQLYKKDIDELERLLEESLSSWK